MRNFNVITFILFLALTNLLSAEIRISSEDLEIDKKNKISIFTGNVHVVEKDLEIWSNTLIIRYLDQTQIEKIIAENNVKVIRNNMVATSEKAIYNPNIDVVKLFINVQVQEDGNTINCDELILDINNSTSIMNSGINSRVEAIIISD